MSIVEIYALQSLFLCSSMLTILYFLLSQSAAAPITEIATILESKMSRKVGNIFEYTLITFLSSAFHSFSPACFIISVFISLIAADLWIKITQSIFIRPDLSPFTLSLYALSII